MERASPPAESLDSALPLAVSRLARSTVGLPPTVHRADGDRRPPDIRHLRAAQAATDNEWNASGKA